MDEEPAARTATEHLSLGDDDFWERPEQQRNSTFDELLQEPCPVRVRVADDGADGFYAVVRHADVLAASKNAALFSSTPSVTTPEPPLWVRKVFGESMVNMDGARHSRLRHVIQSAFTPRRIALIEDNIGRVAHEIVDDIVANRPPDFISAVAAPMPTRVICDMLGVPRDRQDFVLERVSRSSEYIGVVRRPRLRVPGRNLRAMVRLHLLVRELARERRRQPTGDLISALVTADVDDGRLTGTQIGAFFSLLVVAGIETTRNAIAHGLKLLSEHPEQRELLLSDLDRHLPSAVEEILRCSTPIRQFRRRVTRDSTFNGCPVKADDRAVLFYAAANRDPTVFRDPEVFDITRTSNRHLAFGGTGPHYCLGAHLARQEMITLFRELLTRVPDIRVIGEPQLVPSSFDNRIRRLDFTFGTPIDTPL